MRTSRPTRKLGASSLPSAPSAEPTDLRARQVTFAVVLLIPQIFQLALHKENRPVSRRSNKGSTSEPVSVAGPPNQHRIGLQAWRIDAPFSTCVGSDPFSTPPSTVLRVRLQKPLLFDATPRSLARSLALFDGRLPSFGSPSESAQSFTHSETRGVWYQVPRRLFAAADP